MARTENPLNSAVRGHQQRVEETMDTLSKELSKEPEGLYKRLARKLSSCRSIADTGPQRAYRGRCRTRSLDFCFVSHLSFSFLQQTTKLSRG
jgi:hypothetical protein